MQYVQKFDTKEETIKRYWETQNFCRKELTIFEKEWNQFGLRI